ncbi:hypothetical protein EXIGLDRAFT_737032 [Exidia glandulosa HHB12029]|uniref:Uncharacterized protein n=1 Tax=Exidia glandulosa HHB12029 TaxID=1314781 RepID=A0A165J6J1_EXIGL|nr:hypothetical protein EXIGLDRAFT_737032 [Exidia glandulosa HHB12029]
MCQPSSSRPRRLPDIRWNRPESPSTRPLLHTGTEGASVAVTLWLVFGCLPVETTSDWREPLRLVCLCLGPATVLKAYLEPRKARAYLRCNDIWRFQNYDAWKEDLLTVFKEHQLLSPKEEEIKIPYEMKPIVVIPEVLALKCWTPKCEAHSGVRLWNEYNWNHAPRKLRLETLVDWLQGPLSRNKHERPLFLHLLGTPDERPHDSATFSRRKQRTPIKDILNTVPDMTLERVLHSLCGLPAIVADDKLQAYLQQDKFLGVTSKDLLCETCLDKMIHARLWVWWVTVKKQAAPKERGKYDCWFGSDCRLQTYKPDHAYRYNVRRCNTASSFPPRGWLDGCVACVPQHLART